MIPQGRRAVTEAELAAAAGMEITTWRRRHGYALRRSLTSLTPGHPWLYDQEQAAAHLAGKPIPPLPDGEHPDDLLLAEEAAAILGIDLKTLTSYAARGQAAGGRKLYGRRWWTRREILDRRDNPPRGNPVSVGRPRGSRDLRPRRRSTSPRVAEVAEWVHSGTAPTTADIMERYGVTERTAQRTLKAARGLTTLNS